MPSFQVKPDEKLKPKKLDFNSDLDDSFTTQSDNITFEDCNISGIEIMTNLRKRARSSQGEISGTHLQKLSKNGENDPSFVCEEVFESTPPNNEDNVVLDLDIRTEYQAQGTFQPSNTIQHGFNPYFRIYDELDICFTTKVHEAQKLKYQFELSESLPVFKNGKIVMLDEVSDFRKIAIILDRKNLDTNFLTDHNDYRVKVSFLIN